MASASAPSPRAAAPPPRRLLGLSLLLLLLVLPAVANAHPVPTPSPAAKARREAGISAGLVSTLRETLDAIRGVAGIISAFPVGGILGGGDIRLSSAVADCLDLLDLSSDELS